MARTAVRVMAIASDCLHAVKPDEPDAVCARKRFRTDDIKGYLYTRYRSPVVAVAAVSFITFKTLLFAPSLPTTPYKTADLRRTRVVRPRAKHKMMKPNRRKVIEN